MFMILRPSSLAVILLLAPGAFAADWPQTFSGQPDFDFTREEVVTELNEKKEELGFAPYIATLKDVLAAERINPFDPQPRYRQVPLVGGGVTLNPFLPAQLLETEAVTQPAEQEQSLVDMPDFELIASDIHSQLGASKTAQPQLDIAEFEAYLRQIAKRASSKTSAVDLSTLDLTPEVQQLKIQSLVTSPMQYVIIGGRRYSVGDTLTFTVQVPEKTTDILPVLMAEMPAKDAVDKQTYAAYDTVLKTVAAEFTETSEKTRPEQVQARIQRLEERTVVLRIFGKEYKLKWNLLL